MPANVEASLEHMISSGMRGYEKIRRYMEAEHQLNFNRSTFNDVVNKIKAKLGVKDGAADFQALVRFLQGEMRDGNAIAQVDIDDSMEVTAIYYMSAEMIYHARRNGQLLLMDTTFNTNRFKWPLCLVCGIDQHGQTVLLAVAVHHYQTTDAFEWILQQLRSSMHDVAWQSVRCVFTDGDQAMAAALTSTLPHARHLRCRYHLRENLRNAMQRQRVDPITADTVLKEWDKVVTRETEAQFDTAMDTLLQQYPQARSHLTNAHQPPKEQYADFVLNHITNLGQRTTARVESWNSTLKGMLEVNSRTTLTLLFDTLRHAMCGKDERATKRAAADAARVPLNNKARTIEAETSPHLTFYAASLVKLQAELTANYVSKVVKDHGPDGPAVFEVYDRRPIAAETRRRVSVTRTSMSCSCGYPEELLLPCRHVLVVNNEMFHTRFWHEQVGQRWLLAHMPRTTASPACTHPAPGCNPVPVLGSAAEVQPNCAGVPSLNSTADVQPIRQPARTARYGQLTGFARRICELGADFPEAFGWVYTKLEVLARDVEAATSAPPSAHTQPARPHAPAPLLSSVPLHPSVSTDVMQMPPHKKRQRGNTAERRQMSAAEAAAKRACINPSQSI
jgi:hypothetical protein